MSNQHNFFTGCKLERFHQRLNCRVVNDAEQQITEERIEQKVQLCITRGELEDVGYV